jgi:hypothetical protein
MTNDFEVQIEQGTEHQLKLQVTSERPSMNKTKFTRKTIGFTNDEMAQLRAGDPSMELVNQVSQAVSTWLLGEDNDSLRVKLKEALEGERRLRLILRVDADLARVLADVPMELLRFLNLDFAVAANVQGIVHLIDFQRYRPGNSDADFPLKVLIVRSSPGKMKVPVPEAVPIREKILADANKTLGPGRVIVDLLSREPVVAGHPFEKPTLANFEAYLRKNYHILIYLGHGDLNDAGGVLNFEDEDDEKYVQVKAADIRTALGDKSIPVVILTGCLTAADLSLEQRKVVDKSIKGNRGVAQDLVGTESGVHLAVGMRYRLDSNDASLFLTGFFESLLALDKGDVEKAVQRGRAKLHPFREKRPSWSAPVIFRNLTMEAKLGTEPMFPFLLKPSVYTLDELDEGHQKNRETLWRKRIGLPNMSSDFRNFIVEQLTDEDEFISTRTRKSAALLMPLWVEASGGSTVEVKFRLSVPQDFKIEKLEGTIMLTSGAVADKFEAGDILKSANCQYTFGEKDNAPYFKIEAPDGGEVPAGVVFRLAVKIGPQSGTLYFVDSIIGEFKPPGAVVRSVNNAIIVPQV